MRRRRLIELLVVRWGFAAMVAVAISAGLVAAATVAPPADVPSVALRAVPVYRVEVGAAVFLGIYLVAMGLVLAMHNRAFTELGTGGVRAQDLATVSEGAASEEALMEAVMDLTEEFEELRIGGRRWKLATEGRRPDPPAVVQARRERIHRNLNFVRESIERRKAIVNKWRAEEGLPPLEAIRRF